MYLELLRGPDSVRSAFFSFADYLARKIDHYEGPLAPREVLQDICALTTSALERVLSPPAGPEDWERLLRVGESIADLLHPKTQSDLREHSLSGEPVLTSRLPDGLAAVAWELIPVADDKLLGESGGNGRWGIGPAEGRVHPPRGPLTGPVRVLVVAAPVPELGVSHPMEEAARLYDSLRGLDPSIEVDLLTSPTRQDFIERLAHADILHFSGHAEADCDGRGTPGWQLGRDEWFDCRAARSAAIRRPPVLVFANACATANLDRHIGGWGLDGMALALMNRGVRHFVSTIARIPDSGMVCRLPRAFYEEVLDRKSIGEALRVAREKISFEKPGVRNYEGSLLAANYIHYGDPSGGLFETVAEAESYRLPATATAVASPACIGPYRIVGEIGRGHYRTVYRANAAPSGEEDSLVALAVTHDRRQDAVVRQRDAFLELKPKLPPEGHPRILDAAIYEDVLCVVYDLREGRPLDAVLGDRPAPWPVEEVCDLVDRAAEAIDSANSRGIVHGEIVPRDILIGASGSVTLLDAGRAQALQSASTYRTYPLEDLRYRSPEQLAQHIPTMEPSADIWALAVISYELLTGTHPYQGAYDECGGWETALCGGYGPTPPTLIRPDLPEGVAAALWHALSQAPGERFPSAREFAASLRRGASGTERMGGFEPDIEQAIDAAARWPEAAPRLLYVRADDEQDTLRRLEGIAGQRRRAFYAWRVSTGVTRGTGRSDIVAAQCDPIGALDWVEALDEPAIVALLDYNVFLDDVPLADTPLEGMVRTGGAASDNPPPGHELESWDFASDSACTGIWSDDYDTSVVGPAYPSELVRRRLADVTRSLRDPTAPPRTLVVVSPTVTIPQEISKDTSVFTTSPVTADEIDRMMLEESGAAPPPELVMSCRRHASGLTPGQVRDSLRLSIVRHGMLSSECIRDIQRDKEQAVNRQGLLELVRPEVTLDDVAGIGFLRFWIETLKEAADDPLAFALQPPVKGVLLGGMAGCGKSMCAEAIAGTLDWPLLRLDIGRLLGRFLGQSEENTRTALALAEEMAPAVVWIDEIERGFAGATSGGAGGTEQRVLGTFLEWMQERTHGVFVVATANDLAGLPIEVVRAGRFDHRLFLDWPDHYARAEILRSALIRHGRQVDGHDFERLSNCSEGFGGAELVARVESALFAAARNRRREPSHAELEGALVSPPTPLSRRESEAERLEAIRADWLSFCLPA